MRSSNSALNELDSTITGFQSSISGHLNRIESTTQNIQRTTRHIHDQVESFNRQMVKSEEIQLARENVMRIDQIIKERYKDYDTVRRTTMGIVKDFDINLVRNDTVKDLSERLWLTSSRYWLSYALIAVSAWANDYPEVATSALSECCRRDGIKATLFFTLLNLRFDRIDAAREWFFQYLKTLNPEFLQSEAAVMIQAYLAGIFGRDHLLQTKVNEIVETWVAIINDDAQIAAELVESYANYLNNLAPSAEFSYASLREHCTNVLELESVYTDLSKYAPVLELVQSLDVEDESGSPESYTSRIDSIMTSLITNYDQDEEELRNQRKYYELVIKNDGSVNVAQDQYEEMIRLKGDGVNVGKQMVSWVLYDEDSKEDLSVRKFALAHTKGWLKQAIGGFSNAIQERFPSSYKLEIDTWEGMSNGEDQTEQLEDLKAYFETHKIPLIYLTPANIVALILAIVCVGLCFVSLFALIGVALAIAFIVFNIVRGIKKYPERVQAAEDALNACMQEIASFKEFCSDANETRNQIISSLEYGFII